MNSSPSLVKSGKRVFDILEHFAATRKPATLTELASALKFPKSSCLALLETIEACGYAYQQDGRYYLTHRWLDRATAVATHDRVVAQVRPALEALQARIGETLILAQRSGDQVLYLDVVEARHVLRFSAHAGQFKPLHASATGRALASLLDNEERAALIARLKLTRSSQHTITDRQALSKAIEKGAAAGWHTTVGEFQADTTSVAAGLRLNGGNFAIAVGAPSLRIKERVAEIGRSLALACRDLERRHAPAGRNASVPRRPKAQAAPSA